MKERNKRLFHNTFIIGIGTVISKTTQYVILALCTYWMSTSEYGIADICVSTASLIVPVVTIDISQAAFRFSKEKNLKGLLTFASIVSVLGPAICFLLLPLSYTFPQVGSYWLLISCLVLFESIFNSLKEYTRGSEKSKTYVIGGVINAIIQTASCFLFVYMLTMGINGYLLALCVGYFSESVFIFFSMKVYSLIDLSSLDKKEIKEYVKFSLPLMPNTLMWWIISISDRYFVLFMINDSAAGIYSVAAKIPALISVVATLFFKAWEMSAIAEKDSTDKEEYTSNMFRRLVAVVSISISGLLIILRPLLGVLVSPDFYEGWQYATVLIVAAGFSACQAFVGTAYTVEKDSLGCLKTTFVTAVLNIVLNYFLISSLGIMGAAISTLISYAVVLVYRLFDTRKYIKISTNWLVFVFVFLIIVIESLSLSYFPEWYLVISLVSFLLVILMHFKLLKNDAMQLFSRIKDSEEK